MCRFLEFIWFFALSSLCAIGCHTKCNCIFLWLELQPCNLASHFFVNSLLLSGACKLCWFVFCLNFSLVSNYKIWNCKPIIASPDFCTLSILNAQSDTQSGPHFLLLSRKWEACLGSLCLTLPHFVGVVSCESLIEVHSCIPRITAGRFSSCACVHY